MVSHTYAVQENMVLELAGRRLAKAERGVSRTALCEKKSSWLPAFILNYIGGWIFSRLARRCTDDAIWFRGVAAEITSRSDDVSFDVAGFINEVEPHLESLKINLRSIRADLLRYQLDTAANAKLYKVRATLLASLTDFFEAVENLRWCLMELESSRADRLPGNAADTPEALEAMFKELAGSD